VELPELNLKVLGGVGARASGELHNPAVRSRRFSIRQGEINFDGGGSMSKNKPSQPKTGGWCCAKKEEDLTEGGTLSDKLDKVVIVVGKVGVTVATLVFLVMTTRWSVENFVNQGTCIFWFIIFSVYFDVFEYIYLVWFG
jgi:hypothetical protein